MTNQELRQSTSRFECSNFQPHNYLQVLSTTFSQPSSANRKKFTAGMTQGMFCICSGHLQPNSNFLKQTGKWNYHVTAVGTVTIRPICRKPIILDRFIQLSRAFIRDYHLVSFTMLSPHIRPYPLRKNAGHEMVYLQRSAAYSCVNL